MNIIDDEGAQTAAEFLLLFGGIICVVIVAALYYNNYITGLGTNIKNTSLSNVTTGINQLNNTFN